jgi:hypothetical protein
MILFQLVAVFICSLLFFCIVLIGYSIAYMELKYIRIKKQSNYP